MLHVVWVFYYSIICAMVGYGSTCGPPTPPRGSTIIYPLKQEKYEKGSVVLFGCKKGFYLVGKPIIKCLGSTWTQRQFRCVGFCPDLRQISNGQVVDASPNIGQAAVKFSCNEKFRLVGTPRLECIDGRWNGKLPFCEKLKSCPRLRAPPNGILHGSDTTHGAKANFACFTGFDLFGSPTLTCNNGVWSANVPACKAALCSKPAIPSNSYIIYPQTNQVNYTHGTHIFLACRDGHYLKGSPIMVCNQTVWFKREFSCIAFCPVVDSIKNGIITHTTLKEGGEVEITCRTNFTLVGSPKLTCINGKWSDSLPSCKGPCPDPGCPNQGNRIGDDFRHDKTVTFTCPRDYVMEGLRTIKCSDGRWISETPSCKAPCEELAPPAQGRRLGEDFRHGRSARFICSYGYARIGPSTIRCTDGNWNNPAPVCKGICPRPRTPYRGRLHGNKVRFLDGDEVKFSCDSNHDLFGKARLRCIGKKWDSSVPECKASCPDPGHPKNGKTIGSVFVHDSVVKFECLGDRFLQGSSKAKCNNGQWDAVLPTCRDCDTGFPLGMGSTKIPDESIRASSQKDQHPAHHGRLGEDNYWCSKDEKISYIQINLPKTYKITGARIQLKSKYDIKDILLRGHFFNQWMTMHYKKPPYNIRVEEMTPKPFIAQSLRIRVSKKRKESICLRAEVYGCGIPRGCILQGSAVLMKKDGGYRKGYIVGILYGRLEVLQSGESATTIMKTADVILDEEPNVHELATGTVVLGEDINSPGITREGKIEQIADSFCTIKTNDETWKSNLNDVRIVQETYFCVS